MDLAHRLKTLRKEQGLTQEELATATGLSFHSINSYESGRRTPNSKAMVALERYFNVSGEYLRGETDGPLSRSPQKNDPEFKSPEWLRSMFEKIGIEVDELTDRQVEFLVDNAGSLAKMLREEVAKKKKK